MVNMWQNYENFLGDILFFALGIFSIIFLLLYRRLLMYVGTLPKITIYGHLLTLASLLLFQRGKVTAIANGLYNNNYYTIGAKIAIIFCGITACAFSAKEQIYLTRRAFYPLLTLAGLGGFISVSAGNLLLLFMGLAVSSIAIRFMLLAKTTEKESAPIAKNFLTRQALSLGLLALVILWIYYKTGTVSYEHLASLIKDHPLAQNHPLYLYAVIVAIAIPMDVYPFGRYYDPHRSIDDCVDMYIRMFFSVTGALVLMKLTYRVFDPLPFNARVFIVIIGMTGLFVGTFGSIFQNNIRKIFCYVCVGHLGFLFLGLGIDVVDPKFYLLYLTGYILSYVTFLGYGTTIWSQRSDGLQDVRSSVEGSMDGGYFPMLLAAIYFSGMAPSILFYGKVLLFKKMMNSYDYGSGLVFLVLLVAISVIQSLWIIRFFAMLFFQKPVDVSVKGLFPPMVARSHGIAEKGLNVLRSICLYASIFFLFFPSSLMKYLSKMMDALLL